MEPPRTNPHWSRPQWDVRRLARTSDFQFHVVQENNNPPEQTFQLGMIQKSLYLEVTPPQMCKESCSTQDAASKAHLCTHVSSDCELAYVKLGFKQTSIPFIFLKIQNNTSICWKASLSPHTQPARSPPRELRSRVSCTQQLAQCSFLEVLRPGEWKALFADLQPPKKKLAQSFLAMRKIPRLVGFLLSPLRNSQGASPHGMD